MTRISRQQLYSMIWEEPMKKVAPKFGISDVALSKICRRHNIPRPPRGYWAKLAAGKRVTQVPLPDRGLGLPKEIEFGGKRRWQYTLPDDPTQIEIPPRPVFSESFAQLDARVRKLVGKVVVPRDLSRAHPQVQKLLDADDERREKYLKSPYKFSSDAPLYESPYEKRRLRLVSAIFSALSKCGMRANSLGKDPGCFCFKIGEEDLSFTLDNPGVERHDWRSNEDLNRSGKLPLSLEIRAYRVGDEIKLKWQDTPDRKLERQLKDIVVTMIVAGELKYRNSLAWQRDWLIERKADLIEQAKRRAEEERRRLEEELARRQQARIDRLLAEATALQQARTIREYVDAVRLSVAESGASGAGFEVDDWAVFALEQADRIDPVLSGAYLRPNFADNGVTDCSDSGSSPDR